MLRRGRKSQPVIVVDGVEYKACVRCKALRRLDSFRKKKGKPGGACAVCLHAQSAAKYARAIAAPDADRFWSLVDRRGVKECWLWQGHTRTCNTKYTPMTYGSFNSAPAHRIAWILANGRQTKPGNVIRHSCDNPLCCNPAHLSEGTRADNQRDMQVRLRSGIIGQKNPKAKLTPAQVLEIRASAEGDTALGRKYGVHPSTIYMIKVGRKWRNLPGGGPRVRRRKLTPEQVVELRSRHSAGENCVTLGRDYGISQCFAWQVANRRAYRSLGE